MRGRSLLFCLDVGGWWGSCRRKDVRDFGDGLETRLVGLFGRGWMELLAVEGVVLSNVTYIS